MPNTPALPYGQSNSTNQGYVLSSVNQSLCIIIYSSGGGKIFDFNNEIYLLICWEKKKTFQSTDKLKCTHTYSM